MEFIGMVLGLPFTLIGWVISVIQNGFMIGYESYKYGSYKMGLLTHTANLVEELREDNNKLTKKIIELNKLGEKDV